MQAHNMGLLSVQSVRARASFCRDFVPVCGLSVAALKMLTLGRPWRPCCEAPVITCFTSGGQAPALNLGSRQSL